MKAWRLHQFGLDSLRMESIPLPEMGANDIMIKVEAVSLNYRDKAIVEGSYDPTLLQNGPIILASDACGTIVSVGKSVRRYDVGESVVTHVYSRWIDGKRTSEDSKYLLGYPLPGVLSEYLVLHEDAVVRRPEYLSSQEASTLPIAALTAWTAIKEVGKMGPGKTVFIQGTGGVALFATQMASTLGARVLISSSKDEKGKRAMDLGADNFINYRKHPNWEQEVLRETNGDGVDEVIELVAGDITRSSKAIGFGGVIAVVGFLDDPQLTVNVFSLFGKNAKIEALSIGSRRAFEEMNTFMEQHKIMPVIEQVYDFSQVREAFLHLAKGAFGKIVVQF